MEFLLVLGIGMNVFVLLQLIRTNRNTIQAQRIAVVIIIVWTLRFTLFYLKFHPFTLNFPFLLIFDQFLFLLDGALLWLYSKALLKPFKITPVLLLHFVPFAFGAVTAIINSVLYPEEVVSQFKTAVEAYDRGGPIVTLPILLFIGFVLILAIIYFIKSLGEIKKYNYSLFQNYSNIDNLNASWLIVFERLWITLFIIPIILYFLNYIHPIYSVELMGVGLIGCYLILSYFFGSHVLKQSYISPELSKSHRTSAEKKAIPLNNEQVDRLKSLLEKEKYYEDEQLSLNQLANYMSVRPVELTELIKQTEYENFYDLINSYRINAVKEELLESKEQIMIIAYNNGFNSKSTFNKIFKEKTGMTPREYRLSGK